MKRETTPKLWIISPMILFFCGFILFFTMYLSGATFTVDTTADTTDAAPGDGIAEDSSGNCSLRAAIMEANALPGADTIEIPAGTYTLTISGTGEDNCTQGDLDILSPLTINGAGATLTIIDGDQLDRVFHIIGTWNVTISDLTIRNGKSPDGLEFDESSKNIKISDSGSYINGTFKDPNLTNIYRRRFLSRGIGKNKEYKLSNGEAPGGEHGGGILNHEGILRIKGCKITENSTGKGGTHPFYGGGPGGNGGGIYNYDGKITIRNSEISQNSTGKNGGDEISGLGGDGGGIYNDQGTVILSKCIVQENTCGEGGILTGIGGDGGGICNYKGYLVLKICQILDNRSGDGGGLTSGGGGDGGGIFNLWGRLLIKYCTIRFNHAGDGIVDGYGGEGGGICTIGKAKIFHSLIADNMSGYNEEIDAGFGGGIFNMGTLYMYNSTISGNSTQVSFFGASGGGIANLDKALLESCTITQNHAQDQGGGICSGYPDFPTDAITRIHNTLVANNTKGFLFTPNDCSGLITSMGYNYIEVTIDCIIGGDETGNIYWLDPFLGPLLNNGGYTKTHALLPGSLAIDGGDPDDYLHTDQRGVIRPKDGDGDTITLPDIGAFEKLGPVMKITSPLHRSMVWGTIEIITESNTRYADFYIDNKLIHTDDRKPHTCTWDTTAFSNRSHIIKAKGYNTGDGPCAFDRVKVYVDNTIIKLIVTRHVERSQIIEQHYGKITFTIRHVGQAQPVKYVIERKETGGTFNSIKEVPASEIQGSRYTYYDTLPNIDKSYTYRVTAEDESGMIVGKSREKTI